jgi:hypothetical protein
MRRISRISSFRPPARGSAAIVPPVLVSRRIEEVAVARLLSRRSLFTGLGGAAALGAVVASQMGSAIAAPAGSTIQLVNPPLRIADTRSDGTGKVATGSSLDTFVPGLIGEGVVGALLNITITETEGSGFLVATADNAPAPNPTSNVNWSSAGLTLANLALVPAIGTRGITLQAGGAGRTHIVIDLVGFLVGP